MLFSNCIRSLGLCNLTKPGIVRGVKLVGHIFDTYECLGRWFDKLGFSILK